MSLQELVRRIVAFQEQGEVIRDALKLFRIGPSRILGSLKGILLAT